MNVIALILLIICALCKINAYKIPNIDLELTDDGFQVSVPDEPGIQAVFYIIQVDESCPALMDYISEPKQNVWKSLQKTKLQNNDKVELSIMVQYNDVIYERTETRVILNTRMRTTRKSETRNISLGQSKCKEFTSLQQELKPCRQAQTILRYNQPTCKGDLIFEDNFDGSVLNRSIWKHDIRQRMYYIEEELVAFEDRDENCFIKNDILHIVPTVAKEVTEGSYQLGEKCTAIERPAQECNIANGKFFYIKPPVYSAQIHTRDSFSFKYGRIEIRARLPKGDWLFPYLMLQPINTHSETHYAQQMRIAFARGNEHLQSTDDDDVSGNRLYGGIVTWQQGQATEFLRDRLNDKHYGNEFHVYSLLWQREKISLSVDGDNYGDIIDGLDYFNQKCFLIFGVTVGGFINFDDNFIKAEKPYKNRDPKAAYQFWYNKDTWERTWGDDKALEIDYVRIYAE